MPPAIVKRPLPQGIFMIRSRIRALFAAVLCLPLLLGCAAAPWDDPIDVTQLLRMSPNDFRVISVIPRGLGETGKALFRWTILKPDGSEDSTEVFEMRRSGDPRLSPDGHTEVTYILANADRSRFQTQQIHQRAQLLAGFYHVGLGVSPALCDRAGVPTGANVLYSVLKDGSTGSTITTLRIGADASALKDQVPFCV